MTLKTTYQTGDIFQASDINATNTEVNTLSSTMPTKTSELTNDSGFITNAINNLINYYLKSDTYTKAEVNALIDEINQFTYEVADTLPTATASTLYKIYLIPSSSSTAQNVRDEYITIDNGETAVTRYTWEQIGSTSIDLSNYYTKTQTDSLLANKSTVSVNSTGTATDEVQYITIDGTEKKLAGGSDEIFVAVYDKRTGQTSSTYSEVLAAYNAGKTLICKYIDGDETPDPMLTAQYVYSSPDFVFSFPVVEGLLATVGTRYCVLTQSGGWQTTESQISVPQLPATVNNRYLHTNASTGALEWSSITGIPTFDATTDEGKVLKIVNGTPTWVTP